MRAKARDSAGTSGPSLRTRATIGRSSPSPAASGASPTTMPIACRPPLPNGTSTTSPRSTSSRSGGTRYVQVRSPVPAGASTATSTRRSPPDPAPPRGAALPSRAAEPRPSGPSPRSSPSVEVTPPSADQDPAVGVAPLLLLDDRLDLRGGPVDLARLVHDDPAVVALPRELDRRVALPELELVGGFRRPRPQALEQGLERGRDDEHEQRLGHPLLDDLRALDVDLQDDVVAGGERLGDVPARRAVRVAVDLGRLEQLPGVEQSAERVGFHELVRDAGDLARARPARRARDDVVVVRVAPAPPERVDDRVLSDAGRPADDD